MTLAAGRKLGPYVVLAPIAAGGMGVVYRARDTRLERDVAFKVLPESLAAHPVALARFESEAKAVAALSHPGIVAIHDFGQIEGTTFAVSELLEGETLRAVVSRGALPLPRALDVASQVAEALAAAHAQGLVHRDLKPENVFLLRDGRVKLLDFGIAVRAAPLPAPEEGAALSTDPVLDEAGRAAGTAAYMSPEQARGLAVDARSDQFAFGVLLHEMLAGSRPFQGATPIEVLSSILKSPPAALREKAPGLPERVQWIVDRCLSKDPAERYASTQDLARDVRDARAALADRSGPYPMPRPIRQGSRPAAVAALALLVALGFGAGRWTSDARADRAFHETLASRSFQRVTERRLGAHRPDISPSGLQLAYSGLTERGDTDIFVQSVAGGRAVSITSDRPGDDDEPAFSPDGSLIAFRSSRDGGGLFVVEPLGGSPRRVTTFGHDPAWHPDGRRIVFATAATQSPYSRLGGRSELWVADLANGAIRRIFEGDAMQPSVSPNGLRVAFWARRRGLARRDLFTVPVEADSPVAPVAVTDDEAVDWSPFWSADGRYLRFGSDRDGTMNLWQVAVDEASGRPLGAPEPLSVPATHAGPFRASRDQRTIVYEAGTAGFDLEKVPLGGDGLPSGPPIVLLSDLEGISEPSVSPDGRLVAFSSFPATEDLWVVGADGSGLRRITAGPFRDRAPAFSADGGRLFFHSDRSGKFEIWEIRLDGSGLVPFTRCREEQPFGALPSPDGRFVAACTGSEGAHLLPVSRTPDDPLPAPLPRPEPERRFEASAFSPDGRLLAGHAIAPDETYDGAFLLDLASGAYRSLAPDGAWPVFAPGGRRLYLLRQHARLDRAEVALIDLEGGGTRRVLPPEPETPVVAFQLAPDGSALFLVRERTRLQVWIGRLP